MFGYEKDIQDIRSWMKRNGVSASTLGVVALNRSNGVHRLLVGRTTIRTLRKTMQHIRKYPKVKSASRGK